jgi:hypothetical protein|tara:strand:- start:7142 stop:9475 length:2334 start_codon:yes stop_codon:yes gene_type:complete
MSGSDEIKKQAEATRDLKNETQENLRYTRDINGEIRDSLKLLTGEKDLRSSTLKALKESNALAEQQVDLAKDGSKALMDSNKLREKEITFQKNLSKLTANADDLKLKRILARRALQEGISKMSAKEISNARTQIDLSEQAEQAIRGQITNQGVNKEILDQQVAAAEELDSLGSNKLFGTLSNIAKAIPGVQGLTKGFDKAAEASKKIGADVLQKKLEDGKDASLSMGEALSVGFKGAVAGANELMKAFGPIAIIGKVFQGMMKADKSAGEIAKGLNISAKEAGKLSGEMLKASRTSNELGVTYDGQKHALKAINAELGTSTAISAKTLATFSKMENIAGMTQEEMMGIGKLSFATGKDMEKMTGEFLAQAKSASLKHGVLLNEKKLMADISKVSAATTLSLGKNPKAIAEAVATAKSLGMEMSKIEGIADSLLDFESSIENEMQAELLLGRDLNLEKARTAALNNDMATVAEEIAKQAGNAADFGKLGRIEQQALAAAVGMSREELAQMLFTQEQLKGLTEEEATKAQEALDKRIEQVGLKQAQKEMETGTLQNLFDQASEQEKAALAATAMNETFMEMGKSLMPLMEGVAFIAEKMSQNLELVGSIIVGYQIYNGLLAANKASKLAGLALDKKELMFGKSKLAQLAAQAVLWAIANPFKAALGAAVAVGIGAFAYSAMSKAGDVNSPADGKTQISTKEGGLFELSNNDDIVAAPGASAALANAQSSGNNLSMQNLEALQAKTNSLLMQLLSKQGTVQMDSENVGTAVAISTYEISA